MPSNLKAMSKSPSAASETVFVPLFSHDQLTRMLSGFTSAMRSNGQSAIGVSARDE